MTEDDALNWFRERFDVSRETSVQRFLDLLTVESAQQNLISRSTLDDIWARHVVDSAQLLTFNAPATGLWVDIGSGAGLPGIIIALLRDAPMLLVEPRKRRVEFLERAVAELGLTHVEIAGVKVERLKLAQPAAVISARAVAALPQLLENADPIADERTLWLLPKGQGAQSEVEAARTSWQGVFHVKPSLTEAGSGIVVAHGVRRR